MGRKNVLGHGLHPNWNNYNGIANKEILFSTQVLDDIRLNAGRYRA